MTRSMQCHLYLQEVPLTKALLRHQSQSECWATLIWRNLKSVYGDVV